LGTKDPFDLINTYARAGMVAHIDDGKTTCLLGQFLSNFNECRCIVSGNVFRIVDTQFCREICEIQSKTSSCVEAYCAYVEYPGHVDYGDLSRSESSQAISTLCLLLFCISLKPIHGHILLAREIGVSASENLRRGCVEGSIDTCDGSFVRHVFFDNKDANSDIEDLFDREGGRTVGAGRVKFSVVHAGRNHDPREGFVELTSNDLMSFSVTTYAMNEDVVHF
jgi:translation elongation factor EF-Tu-like GTPase